MTRRPAVAPTMAPTTVTELARAPELAAVALLDHALDVVTIALLAEHPTLIDDFHRPREQGPVLSLAYTLCRRAAALRDVLVRYRRAVRDADPGAHHDLSAHDDDILF